MKYLIVFIPFLMLFSTSKAYYKNKGWLYHLELPDDKRIDQFQHSNSKDCFIMLYDNEHYLIELISSLTDDMSYSTYLSSGWYHWNNDSLCLKDIKYGYELCFISVDSVTMENVNGYPFMSGRCFTGGMRYLNDYPDLIEFNNDIIDEISSYNSSSELHYELNYKTYYYKTFVEYAITLQEDYTYTIDYDGLTLSKGTWKRNGNLIIMEDSFLKSSYYALIRENELESYTIDFVCKKIILK